MKPCSIAGCTGSHLAKGFCEKHYWRNHRHGDPLANPDNDGQPLAWLKAHVAHDDEACLKWPFGYGDKGYGSIHFRGRTMGAHRAMCFLSAGDPPTPDHKAAHSCGRGHEGCVNPRHLRWATQLENAADMIAHREKGINSAPVKLSAAECDAIRDMKGKASLSVLAARFQVSRSLVSRILNGHRRKPVANSREAA